MSKTHKIKLVQPDSGMSCELEVSLAPKSNPVQNITLEPWDNFADISGIAEKFFGVGTPYEGDKLVENMTLEDGVITMPKEDNNSSHEPIEYEIGLTSETDYVPIKIIWKGQYPTIRKMNLEDEWEEVYDLSEAGKSYPTEGYYKQIGSTVKNVHKTHLGSEQEIPQDVFKYAHNVTSFYSTFSNCSGLTSIPEGLFDGCTNVTTFNSTFSNCSGLTSIPEGLFRHCYLVKSFDDTFYNCRGLTSIPEGLFDNNKHVTNFTDTFSRCESLYSSTPTVTTKDGDRYKLWELAGKLDYPEEIDGNECFYRCDKLYDYKRIPEDWK